jgi:iron complex outermembrane receptor protein
MMIGRTFVSALAISWAGAAYAQTSSDTQPTAPAPASKETSASPEETDARPGDIVVYAQRRSERLVDVPISITAVSTEALEQAGPTSLENLTKVVPGVYIQRAVYGLSPTIRGIGSTLSASGGEQNVATYIDGVYQPTPTGNVFDLASVAGVEVLKGPQGTLFGRNATGGALLVKTLDPGFQIAGRFNVSYERFDQIRSSAYLNLPITDTIAINGAVAYRYSKGYIRDNRTNALVNEGNNFTARGKLLFEPSPDFSLILTASHSEFDDPTGSNYVSGGLAGIYQLPGLDTGPVAYDRFHTSHNTKDIVRTTTDEYNARATLELDFGTITSTTAYIENDLYSINDLDNTYATIPAPITLPPPLPPIVVGFFPTDLNVELNVHTKTFSQEFNLSSKGSGPFSYIAGLYYFHNRAQVPYLLSSGAPLFNASGTGKSYAAYAEGTYKFGDLAIFAGARFTHENSVGKSAQGVSAPSPFTRIQTSETDKWTPRIGMRYTLSPSANVYATFSKGFKSGVFDLTSPNGPAVKPETVDAFEVGFKSSSSVLSLNAAAFYYDYRDSQVNSTVSGQNGAIFNQLFNVPKAEIYGIDIDGTLRFGDAFDIRAAVAYTHTRYVDFKTAPGYTNDPANPDSVFGLINANIIVDASGNTMVRAPELTASATFGYHATLGGGNRLDLTVSPYYSSRVYFDFANTLDQKPYATVDAAATLTLGENTRISVFGRNLTDAIYSTARGLNAVGASRNYAMPRTYGVSLGYSF